jgi:hypothetical protein
MMLQEPWSTDDAVILLGAMEGFVRRHGPVTAQQTRLMDFARRRLDLGARVVPVIEPEQLTQVSADRRTDAMRLVTVLACYRGELDGPSLDSLDHLNVLLKQPTPWPRALRHGSAGRTMLATLALAKWTPDGKALLRAVWKDEGVIGVLKAGLSARGKSSRIPPATKRSSSCRRTRWAAPSSTT